MAIAPSSLSGSLRGAIRRGNSVRAVVESSELGYATVRLSDGGSRLTNLSTLGGAVEEGDEVYVDYRAGVAPTVRAIISETLVDNPCIYQAARAPNKSVWPDWEWPDWEWPDWEWPDWEWPDWDWDWPPWDWPVEEDPPEDTSDIDIGIMVTRYDMGGFMYPDAEGWGQPMPMNEDITVRFCHGDPWGGWDHPDEAAWGICGWDTFGNFPWTEYRGDDKVVIPRSGVYIMDAWIGYWVIFQSGSPDHYTWPDDWYGTYYYHDKSNVVLESWITVNGVEVAKDTQAYFDTWYDRADQTNSIMTIVKCNEGDVVRMHVRHSWLCWFTDVWGGMCQNRCYGMCSDAGWMLKVQLIPGTQGAED